MSKSFKTLIICSLVVCCSTIQTAQAKVLSVYLTWQGQETHDNITINYVTDKKINNEVLYSELNSQTPPISQSSIPEKLPGQLGYLNRIELTQLEANKAYQFWVRTEDGSLSDQFKFKTLPKTGGQLRFMQGGDMGTSRKVVTTTFLAQEKNPNVILIGGDVAYANGGINNYKRWQNWFGLMNDVMTDSNGFLIPMVVVIGNHETNTSSGSFSKKAPFFSQLFKVSTNKSYFLKKFSDHTVLFGLDTDHVTSHEDQKDWLIRNMRAYKNVPNLMALYHVPMYPAHRSDSGFRSVAAKKHWLPTFDKYGLDIGFENHDHVLKRTYMMRNSKKVSRDGTVFIGDGCWGRSQRSAKQKSYLKVSKEANHVWMIEATRGQLFVQGMGKEDIYDTFTLDTINRKILEVNFSKILDRPDKTAKARAQSSIKPFKSI